MNPMVECLVSKHKAEFKPQYHQKKKILKVVERLLGKDKGSCRRGRGEC
jgi:hypothetical protein